MPLKTTITIRDQTPTGRATNELTLDILTERLTVRQLIRGRVYQEVQDYNLKTRLGSGQFKGLIQPEAAEQMLNGPRPLPPNARREIDWKKQFEMACEAFETNGFFVLVGERQVESLEEEVVVRHDTVVSFVKLVQLVGG